MSRNWNSPRYVRWRKAVYARDGFRCRLCGRTDDLNAHHVKTWARYPSLRFVVGNGITLCAICHLRVRGCEAKYEAAFERLIRPRDKRVRLGMILKRYGQQEEGG